MTAPYSEISPKDLFIVVDDYKWVQILARWRLKLAFGSDIRVEFANTGAEAVALFLQLVNDSDHNRINSIFMDFHMPELAGTSAIKFIRLIEIVNHLSPVNVIGCSSDMSSSLAEEFYDAGADSVLSKPVELGEMEALCVNVNNEQ